MDRMGGQPWYVQLLIPAMLFHLCARAFALAEEQSSLLQADCRDSMTAASDTSGFSEGAQPPWSAKHSPKRISLSRVAPRYCATPFYLSRVRIFISRKPFFPLKWHCGFHENLNGVILSSFYPPFVSRYCFFSAAAVDVKFRSSSLPFPLPQGLYKLTAWLPSTLLGLPAKEPQR